MSNKRWRPESNEPIGDPKLQKNPSSKGTGTAQVQAKGHGMNMHGKSQGWPISEGNKSGWVSDPKGGKQHTAESQGGLKTSTKKPEKRNGGHAVNGGNHAKKQGWKL